MFVMLNVDTMVDDGIFKRIGSPKEPWLQIAIFSTTRAAEAVRSRGGFFTDTNGQIVRPLAIVRNVVITLFASATPMQRERSLRAARLLRRQQ